MVKREEILWLRAMGVRQQDTAADLDLAGIADPRRAELHDALRLDHAFEQAEPSRPSSVPKIRPYGRLPMS